MTLPASVPTGLTVATFRAGLSRGLGAAAPAVRLWFGQGAPGEYRSPFPVRLRAARAALVVLALLWLAVGFSGLNATRDIVRTVGHDTAPSVSSAEAIRTGLAAANADYALAMLSNEGDGGSFLSAMRMRLRAVRTAIVDAAGNVTYGDEERGPIGTILQGLGDYEQLVGRSVASSGNARPELAFAADDLLHWTVLPAAVTLGRVNADHLSADYAAFESRHVLAWLLVAAALLLVGLIGVQVDIARTAKRLINPGLLVATAAILAATALVAIRLTGAQADVRVAKVDAFDSISALSAAGAIATDFDAAESLGLLTNGDPVRRVRYVAENALRARRLLGVSPDVARNVSKPLGDVGYLGDEMANVTFPGERAAAGDLVDAWGGVLRSDAGLAAEQARGDFAAALADKTATAPNGVRSAFARFDAALAKVRAINQDAFVSSIASAERDDAPLGATLVAGFVLAVAAAWFGIGRRLDEYRF